MCHLRDLNSLLPCLIQMNIIYFFSNMLGYSYIIERNRPYRPRPAMLVFKSISVVLFITLTRQKQWLKQTTNILYNIKYICLNIHALIEKTDIQSLIRWYIQQLGVDGITYSVHPHYSSRSSINAWFAGR